MDDGERLFQRHSVHFMGYWELQSEAFWLVFLEVGMEDSIGIGGSSQT